MPTITIKPTGQTQEAAEGSKLIDALHAAGIPMECTCNAPKPKFDACHIFLLEGKKGLAKMSAAEADHLDRMIGVGSKSRFACEVVLGTEPLTIELLGALSG
jgi:2Fe-2S ferredoxin